jgi:hypothetical protein
MHSGAKARRARGSATAPASWVVFRLAGWGQEAASPPRARRPLRLSSRPCVSRAAPAAWSPDPSPRRRPVRRAVKGYALVMAKHGLAVDRRHFPATEHAERVGKQPAHRRGDLARGTDRQRSNVLVFDRKCDGPLFPQALRFAAPPPWCRDPARSDIETPLSPPVFVVRLHKTRAIRMPGPSGRGRAGSAVKPTCGTSVSLWSRPAVWLSACEARRPVGQHALCADRI